MGLFNFFKKPKEEISYPFTSAIVAASGCGSRMNGICNDKLLFELGGMPVIGHTLINLESSVTVNEIIVVTNERNLIPYSNLIKSLMLTKVKCVIKGGNSRQESVFNGISSVNENTKYIAIHDGARPFASPSLIDEVNLNAFKYGASAVGVMVKDTVKKITSEGLIENTLDRSFLVNIQTPQTFNLESYLLAVSTANQNGKDYTDDCQLFEAIGKNVFVTMGNYNNIKITTPEDLILAENILNMKADENIHENR